MATCHIQYRYAQPIMKPCHLLTSTTFSNSKAFEDGIAKNFSLVKISVRDLIVEKVTNPSTSEFGKEINHHIQKGEIIPGILINKLIEKSISDIEKGIIISGFPKNIEQFNMFNELLNKYDYVISKLWVLEVNNIEELISEKQDQNVQNLIREKFEIGKKLNQEVSDLIENKSLISKVKFDYPIDWNPEDVLSRIGSA